MPRVTIILNPTVEKKIKKKKTFPNFPCPVLSIFRLVLPTADPIHMTSLDDGRCAYCIRHRLKADARTYYEPGNCSACGHVLAPKKAAVACRDKQQAVAQAANLNVPPLSKLHLNVPPLSKLLREQQFLRSFLLDQAARRGVALGGCDGECGEVGEQSYWQ